VVVVFQYPPEASSGLRNVALLEVVALAFPIKILLKCLEIVLGPAVPAVVDNAESTVTWLSC
jgi:hypothetical protein